MQIEKGRSRKNKVITHWKEGSPSHKLQKHAYDQQNPFELKEDNPSQKSCQLSCPSLHCKKQELSEEFDSRKVSQLTKSEQQPQLLVK